MSVLLNYLNSPHLVANFQKVFGIESHFDSDFSTTNDINHNYPIVANRNLLSNGGGGVGGGYSSNHHQNYSTNENNSSIITQRNLIKKDEPKDSSPSTEITDNVNSKSTNNDQNQTKHKRNTSNTKILDTDHTNIIANTTIHSQFWYYLFCLGAAMGNEVFYCLFFPFWFWNVDGAIARKVGFLWGIFMYVGQATKDLLCMPRPASPPVVKLEERYRAEYGFPSTHAMVSAGLPISLVVLSYSRYNINLYYSIALAAFFCCWVCCSRLYLGMHSLLDVIAGVLYSMLVLILVMPILEPVDQFMLDNQFSPYIALTVGFLLCVFYPSLKQWSTARGDTTIIIGTVVGFSVGSYLNNNMGYIHKPDEPPLYDIHFPNAIGYIFGVLRTVMGLLILVATRQFFKSSLLKFMCYIHGLNSGDESAKKQKKIELPYYYITYFAIGLNVAFTSPYLFRLLNIERDYSYTEL